jgi:hypothetical protein
MDGTTTPMKAILAEADLVFGIWQNNSESYGVGKYIIKGKRCLEAIVASGDPSRLCVNAIPSTSLEQAVAARKRSATGAHFDTQ